MSLKTERLTIRHIVSNDWKSIRDIWIDFNASEYAQYDTPHITEDVDVQSRIAKWAAANSGTEHMFFAICLDETVIGYIAFNIREKDMRLVIASTLLTTEKVTPRKAILLCLTICVHWASQNSLLEQPSITPRP